MTATVSFGISVQIKTLHSFHARPHKSTQSPPARSLALANLHRAQSGKSQLQRQTETPECMWDILVLSSSAPLLHDGGKKKIGQSDEKSGFSKEVEAESSDRLRDPSPFLYEERVNGTLKAA